MTAFYAGSKSAARSGRSGPHWAPTGLIEIENTHNMAGGTVYPLEVIREICDGAHELGLKVHMDGARVFNAAEALGVPVREIVAPVDTVMFCLSKALGRAGGIDAGGNDARISSGAGSTASGWAAACDRLACWRRRDSSRSRNTPGCLRRDHENARFLAQALARIPGISIDPQAAETNILIFDVSGTGLSTAEFSARLKSRGVLFNGVNTREMRIVTHYDVDRSGCERALEAIEQVAVGATAGARVG